MSDPNETTPPASPAPPAPAPPASPAPLALPDQEPPWFPERLNRGIKAAFKEAGFSSPEEAKAAKEALAKVEADRKAAELAQLSEVERLKKLQEESEAARKAAEAKAAELERKMHVDEILRKKGIGNPEYAHFLIDKERNGASDFDYDAAVSRMLGDPKTKAALELADASSPEAPPVVIKASTSPVTPGNAPKPPTSGLPSGKTAKEMTDEEWARWKRENGANF